MTFITDNINQAIDFFIDCGDCEMLRTQPELSQPGATTLPSLSHVLSVLNGAPSMTHALTGAFHESVQSTDTDELLAIDEGWYRLMEVTANSSCTLYPAAYALFTDNRISRLVTQSHDPYIVLFHIAKTVDVIYYDEFHSKAGKAITAWTGKAFTWDHSSHLNRCKDLADALFGAHWWQIMDVEFDLKAGISFADIIWHERPPLRPELTGNFSKSDTYLPEGLDNIAS